MTPEPIAAAVGAAFIAAVPGHAGHGWRELRVVAVRRALILGDGAAVRRPARATRHAALPMETGTKYVVTQWYRQGEWSLQQRDYPAAATNLLRRRA